MSGSGSLWSAKEETIHKGYNSTTAKTLSDGKIRLAKTDRCSEEV